MIYFIEGRVCEVEKARAVLDIGSIGLEVIITKTVSDRLVLEQKTFLYIFFLFKNEGLNLYGFLDKLDRTLFSFLIQITGIGPKTALNILDELSWEEIYRNAAQKNSHAFTKVNGIGPKAAERLTIELGYKLKQLSQLNTSGEKLNTLELNSRTDLTSDAADVKSALLNMGFSEKNITSIWDEGFTEKDTIESNLTRFLKLLRSK